MKAIPAKLLPIVGMVFLMTLGMGMMIPVLPRLAAEAGGVATDSGLLLSAFGAARLLVGMPAGAVSDRLGRRLVMLAGVALFATGSFVVFAGAGLGILVTAQVLQGLGSGCYVTAALAAVADLSEEGGRGRLMSLYQAGMLAGVSIGPAAGGFIVGGFGVKAPFVVQGVAAVAGGLCAMLMMAETRRRSATGSRGGGAFAARVRLLASPAMLGVCGVMFGTYFSRVVANWQVVPILAHDDFAYDARLVGLLLTGGAIGNFAALPLASRVIDRWGARAAILAGGAVALLGIGLLVVPARESLLWISVLLMGASGSLLGTACASFVAGLSTTAHGLTMGTLRTAGDIGLVAGPLGLVALVTHSSTDLRTGLAVVGATMAGLLVAFAVASRARFPA